MAKARSVAKVIAMHSGEIAVIHMCHMSPQVIPKTGREKMSECAFV